jgi:hypothetical protein
MVLSLYLVVAVLHLAAEDFRAVPLPVPERGRTGFTLLSPESTGLLFTNFLAEDRHLTNQILLNASGMAAGDVDGDGLCDLYFCALDNANALFKNLGQWKFKDITQIAGVACRNQDSTAALLADLDGDGDLDLVVNAVEAGLRIFFNDGQARFQESTRHRGLNSGRGGSSMAAADIDGDGDLDLYVGNYRKVTLRDQPNTKFTFSIVDGQAVVTSINGKPLTDPEYTNRFDFNIKLTESGGKFSSEEKGEPDLLLRNDGRGNFTQVPFTDGTFLDENGRPLTAAPNDWALSVLFRDLNGDRAPDLYICNDFKSPDRIWINDGQGRFRALPALAIRQTCLSAMGLDVADINRDGYDDIFVLDMLSPDLHRRLTQRMELRPEVFPPGIITNRPQSPRNMLFLNRGDGTYAEIAQYAGLEAADWAWTPPFLDVDLDGYEDLLISNGFERDGMHVDTLMKLEALKKQQRLPPVEQLRLRKMFPKLETPNLAYRNQGNLRFVEQGAAWGFNAPIFSQAAVLADLDNDGDQDVVLCLLNGPVTLYRNETAAPRLAVRLKGQINTHGIGAKIIVRGGPVPQSQEIFCGGRYLSNDEALRVFAAGPPEAEMTIEVLWRSGRRSLVEHAKPNHLYEIQEPTGPSPATQPPAAPSQPPLHPWFEPVTTWPGHTHVEPDFDDFERQPMLAHGQSRPGPGAAWFDLDGDGWDDLILGSGTGGQLAVFRNDGHGGLQRWTGTPFNVPVTRDQTGLLGWRQQNGRLGLILAGSSNYEDGSDQGSLVRFYNLERKTAEDPLPGQTSSTGPLAMADLDNDNHLDLFVGGRVIPGRYPEPASSLIFHNTGNAFELDKANSARLEKIGLVQGAVFSDLDEDGDPDLVLAWHWGPVRVFVNNAGQLEDKTESLGLAKFLGWWNGVATGDFDEDGRLDIVASNWGQNTRYERFRTPNLQLMAGDLDGNGTVETIEVYQPPDSKKLLPLQPLHVAMRGFPMIGAMFSTCEDYAKADLPHIYGDALKNTRTWEVNWLETTLFLNRGTSFVARPLPQETQLTPAFAIGVADLNGDGHEDIFLSQNFFNIHPEISRYDAGRALCLQGDGQGQFRPLPGPESGVMVYGEQRGAALGDYDADGRVDLVVTQNGAETKLFKNTGTPPGLRVRLIGPPGNPQAVGASLRVITNSRLGPAREIQAGSGYYSQNSAVQVFAANPAPTALWIRWPGGRVAQVPVPPNAREMVVDLAKISTAAWQTN